MNGDYVERLRSFLDAHRPDSARHVTADVLATLPNPDGRGWRHLTGEDLRAALDELEQLRADNSALLDGNRRLQAMNDGLRQMAIEAREAAEGWHRATIDLYSGRQEPHPADCPCDWPESGRAPQQPEYGARNDAPPECPTCGRTDVSLRKDGRMRSHSGDIWIGGFRQICRGGGELPKAATPQQPDRECPCGCPVVDDMCSCVTSCLCEPRCGFCDVPADGAT